MQSDEQTKSDQPVVVDRVNVALIIESAEAMEKLRKRTGLKKVDIVNRALQLYEFIDAEIRAGKKLVVRDSEGIDQLVKII